MGLIQLHIRTNIMNFLRYHTSFACIFSFTDDSHIVIVTAVGSSPTTVKTHWDGWLSPKALHVFHPDVSYSSTKDFTTWHNHRCSLVAQFLAHYMGIFYVKLVFTNCSPLRLVSCVMEDFDTTCWFHLWSSQSKCYLKNICHIKINIVLCNTLM